LLPALRYFSLRVFDAGMVKRGHVRFSRAEGCGSELMMLLRLRWGMKRAYCCESGGGEGCGQEDDELGELHFAGRIWKIELIGIGCLNGWRLDCWRSMMGMRRESYGKAGGFYTTEVR
jgi:hypothetical protein